MTETFGSGAPASDEDGKRPKDPGMTEDSSERLQTLSPLLSRLTRNQVQRNPNLHVSEQILRQDHPIQLPRITNHNHRRRIHQHVIQLQLRILLLDQFRHSLSPQPRRGEDVGLVNGVDGEGWGRGESDLSSDASDALDFGDGVGGGVHGDTVFPGFFTVTKVCPSHPRIQNPYSAFIPTQPGLAE